MFRTTSLSLALATAAATFALACGPAAAQTTREMGKDSSRGTTSADSSAMNAKNGTTAPKPVMQHDGMKHDGTSGGTGTDSGTGATGATTSGSTAGNRTGTDTMGGTGGSSTATTGPKPKSY